MAPHEISAWLVLLVLPLEHRAIPCQGKHRATSALFEILLGCLGAHAQKNIQKEKK